MLKWKRRGADVLEADGVRVEVEVELEFEFEISRRDAGQERVTVFNSAQDKREVYVEARGEYR